MNMVERVASQIALADLRASSASLSTAPMETLANAFKTACEDGHYLAMARAAIEAMREPTDEMVNPTDDVVVGFSGEYGDYNEYCSSSVAKEIWTVMIDAALQE